jgi:phosphoenolpyruvate carboxykinase (GTP)
MTELLKVDTNDWLKEVESIKIHYSQFGDRLPQGLKDELAALEQRLLKKKK